MSEAEDKIILATVECIEEYGINGTTIRRIGDKAGMNSAAINYYFRSKDALMERVFSTTLNNAFDWEDFIYTENMPLKEQLNEIFVFLSVKSIEYRNISRAHFYEIIEHENYNTMITVRMNAFLEKVFSEVKRKKPDLPDGRIRMALTQLAAATLPFFSIYANLFDTFSGLDMDRAENRAKYVKSLVETLAWD